MMTRKCGAKLRGAFMGYCERPPTIERDGMRWCWQHDPKRLTDARNARAERMKADARARDARIEAEFNRSQLEKAAGIRGLSDDDLRGLVALGGIRAILSKTKT